MAVYNGQDYICDAVKSILNQTFRDFEFVIINDGSTDKTEELLTSFSDPRIIVIKNQRNQGRSRSRNVGLTIAGGEYIAHMDADDISLPDRLEKQVKFLDQNPNVGAVGSSWYLIDADGQEIGIVEAENGEEVVHFTCHGSVLIRRECYEKVGYYREAFQYSQDFDMWLRIIEAYNMMNLKEPHYKYRVKSNSAHKNLLREYYGSLALDMAEERRKTGVDALDKVGYEGAITIVNDRLNMSGVKRRKAFSKNHQVKANAFFSVGKYREAYYESLRALNYYLLNLQSWSMLIECLTIRYYGNPVRVVLSIFIEPIRLFALQSHLYSKLKKQPFDSILKRIRKLYWVSKR